MNLAISCNLLEQITTPQTLKIEGYIKMKKVLVLIDSGSPQNFIHCKIAKDLNYLLYPTLEFQVTVANGGTINLSRKCHNMNITMGEYVLNNSNSYHSNKWCRFCIMSLMVTMFGDYNF